VKVVYFQTEAGRSQPVEFIDRLEADDAAAILADIEALRHHGDRAPIQMRSIKGYRPMMEIKTGGFRTFFVRRGEVVWILHVCKKQDQQRGIRAAAARMKQTEG
jgi:hypothetical protein